MIEKGNDIDTLDSNKLSALGYAILGESRDCVKFLLN